MSYMETAVQRGVRQIRQLSVKKNGFLLMDCLYIIQKIPPPIIRILNHWMCFKIEIIPYMPLKIGLVPCMPLKIGFSLICH